MIPPSIWLRAPSGLITRPTSWIAITFSTRTSPVPTSTATSASWIPKVRTRIPVGLGPRAPLPRIWLSASRPVISVERPAAAVGADDVAIAERERRLGAVEPLRGQLDHLACGIRGRRADGRAHRRERRRAARDRRERAASRVADLYVDVVEREPQLLRRDHRHRRARARADVLHRRDNVGAAVGAEPDPGVAGRTAAAVPDLARHPHPALPDLVRAGADLGPAGPVRLRAPVALHQALRGERAAVHGVRVRVVELAQLERVDAELRRELVEDALERPRPLDEAGRAERGHRREVQLRAVLDRADVLAGVEQLRRPCCRRQPARPAERAGVLAAEGGQRPVGPSRRGHALARGVAIAGDDVLLAPGEPQRTGRPVRFASSAARRM